MKPRATSNDLDSKIILHGVHVELTPTLQDIIRKKFSVLLRHEPRILRIDVRLHSNQTLGEKHLYRVSAQIELGGPDLNASAEGAETYDVLDECVAKLTTLLERRHGLRKDRRNHPQDIELAAAIPKTSSAAGDET